MNPKKTFFLLLSCLIVFIVMVNIIASYVESSGKKAEYEYFKQFSLNLKGIICNVEEQTDTYKFLITLRVLESNYEEYNDKGVLGAMFCVKKNEWVVFADHYENYMVGDTVFLGYDKTNLIKCKSMKGELKLIKKRSEAMVYDLSSPNKRMKELVRAGCQ